MAHITVAFVVWCIVIRLTNSQELGGVALYGIKPGTSSSCNNALQSKVLCHKMLPLLAQSSNTWPTEVVEGVCEDACHESLVKASQSISKACTTEGDGTIVAGAQQPATYIVDHMLYALEASCRKDNATGAFCDPWYLTWPQDGDLTFSDKYCSDCWLSGLSCQLSNPLGYDESLADNFKALTSSCKAAGYAYTSPTAANPKPTGSSDVWPSSAYTRTGSVTGSAQMARPTGAMSTPECKNSVTVQPNDDCNSIARANHVSTYDLIHANSIDLYCQGISAKIGQSLCIPAQCDTYTWQIQDSCEDILKRYPHVSRTQFMSWNPPFNLLCHNSAQLAGFQICVSPPGGYISVAGKGKSSDDEAELGFSGKGYSNGTVTNGVTASRKPTQLSAVALSHPAKPSSFATV